MAQAPAGWYPQPDGTQRYWDGAQWTEHVSGTPAAAAAAAPTPAVAEPVPAAEPEPVAVAEAAVATKAASKSKAKAAAATEPVPAEPLAEPAVAEPVAVDPVVIAGSDMPAPAASGPAPAVPMSAAPMGAAPAKKRKVWPIIVGVIVAIVVIFIIAIVAVFVVLKNAVGDPTIAVNEYDQAWQQADCALMQGSTTQEFQEFQGYANCDDFLAAAEQFAGTIEEYNVDVVSTQVANDTATVNTSEYYMATDGFEATYEYEYVLVKEDGKWLISSVENIGG